MRYLYMVPAMFKSSQGIGLLVITGLLASTTALAQSSDKRFEAAAHLALAASSEFDEADAGIGGRVAWNPFAGFGAEAEITLYPRKYPDNVAFSRRRWEGFFGATIGPRLGRFRPFAKLRPGFVSYQEAPEPFACILIFPPPLACTLAGGRTVPAFDLGGGIDLTLTDRAFIRFDAGDRLLRYEGPVLDANRTRHDDDFWTHEFRFSVGAGIRF